MLSLHYPYNITAGLPLHTAGSVGLPRHQAGQPEGHQLLRVRAHGGLLRHAGSQRADEVPLPGGGY